MEKSSIEERLEAVESAVRDLQHKLDKKASSPSWLDQVIGSLKDEPAFVEVIAYGQALREADQLSDDDREPA